MKAAKTLAGLSGAGLIALTLGALAPPASADPVAGSNDKVGVGSDTTQYLVDFLDDGAGITPGYNFTHPGARLQSYDATNPITQANKNSTPVDMVILRQGQAPIPRPFGSGDGTKALGANGGTSNPSVNFARVSRPLLTTNDESSKLTSFGVATDNIQIAVVRQTGTGSATAVSTDAPGGLTNAELVNIYKGTYRLWSDIPNYTSRCGSAAGTSGFVCAPSNTIIPEIPQSNSGTRIAFESSLNISDSDLTNPNLDVTTENDPTFLQSPRTNATPPVSQNAADAIAPFASSKQQLDDSGFFNTTQPNYLGATKLLTKTATTPDNTTYPFYTTNRTVFDVVRNADKATAFVTSAFASGGFYTDPDNGDPLVCAAFFTPIGRSCS